MEKSGNLLRNSQYLREALEVFEKMDLIFNSHQDIGIERVESIRESLFRVMQSRVNIAAEM